MAKYYLFVKVFSRGKGSRVTKAAAYRAGERIRDERTCGVYDPHPALTLAQHCMDASAITVYATRISPLPNNSLRILCRSVDNLTAEA